MAKDDAENGLADDVTSISTGRVVEAPQQPVPARRQTRAAAVVKEAVVAAPSAQAIEAPLTQPTDGDVMDGEFEDVSGEAETVGHGDEPPM